MKLNAEQQKKVEDNLGLVNKVINDKVHGPYYRRTKKRIRHVLA